MVTRSLFPTLTRPMRWPFRHGLVLVFAGLLTFSMLRWLAPLVILVCVGMPLLFAIYVWQSGIAGDSRAAMIVGAGSAGAISVAWWVWTGDLVAREYGVPIAAGSQLQHQLSLGLTATLIGVALMLITIVGVRLFHRRVSGSLDGFAIGATCALAYSAAGTTAWLAPQFATGLLDGYGRWRFFEEAYLYGFIDPVTSVVVGGCAGLRLWYRVDSDSREGPGRVRRMLSVLTAVGIAVYVGIYLIDAAQLARSAEIVTVTALTAIGLVTLRAALRLADVPVAAMNTAGWQLPQPD